MQKQKKAKTMEVKRIAEEWEIWDKEEKAAESDWCQKSSTSGLKSLARNS